MRGVVFFDLDNHDATACYLYLTNSDNIKQPGALAYIVPTHSWTRLLVKYVITLVELTTTIIHLSD